MYFFAVCFRIGLRDLLTLLYTLTVKRRYNFCGSLTLSIGRRRGSGLMQVSVKKVGHVHVFRLVYPVFD